MCLLQPFLNHKAGNPDCKTVHMHIIVIHINSYCLLAEGFRYVLWRHKKITDHGLYECCLRKSCETRPPVCTQLKALCRSCTCIPSGVVGDLLMLCFEGGLSSIPVQSHCVTVWCNPSMNASSLRRMSKRWRERECWKVCQWFTWLLCGFTSCASPHVHGLRCSTQYFSGGLWWYL